MKNGYFIGNIPNIFRQTQIDSTFFHHFSDLWRGWAIITSRHCVAMEGGFSKAFRPRCAHFVAFLILFVAFAWFSFVFQITLLTSTDIYWLWTKSRSFLLCTYVVSHTSYQLVSCCIIFAVLCPAPGAPPCKALSDSRCGSSGFRVDFHVRVALQSLGERAMSAMSAMCILMSATNHHYHHTANTQLILS